MYAVLTDSRGNSTLGSDGKVWVGNDHDRMETDRIVREYRDGFNPNFPSKVEAWTHYGLVASLRQDPIRIFPIH